jgi:hypothetical protein
LSSSYPHWISTDTKGQAVYRQLAPGRYSIRVEGPGSTSDYVHSEIGPGETTVRLHLAPVSSTVPDGARRSLHGTITNAATGGPIARVRLGVQGRRYRTAYTGGRGAYCLPDLPAEVYTIYVTRDGYGSRVVRDFRVEQDGEHEVNLALEPAATLHLRMRDDRGRPVAGEVRLWGDPLDRRGVPTVNASLRASVDGQASYYCILPGRYRIKVSARDRGEKWLTAEIALGENSYDIQLK